MFVRIYVYHGMYSGLAYSPATVDFRNDSASATENLKNITWVQYEQESEFLVPKDEELFTETDSYFIFEDGTVFIPFDSGRSRAACTHTIAGAINKLHQARGKGCTVTTYRIRAVRNADT